MKTIRVTAVDYENEKFDGDKEPIVQLAGRSSDGERITLEVEDCVPYFYVRENKAYRIQEDPGVREIKPGFESYDGIPLARIDVQIPGNVGDRSEGKNLTKEFDETWESDIPFYRRVSIDYDLTGHIRVPETDRCSINDIDTDVDIDGDDIIDPRIFIADIEVVQDEDQSFDEMVEEYDQPVSNITVWDSQADEYIFLYLDPDERVDNGQVKEYLQEQADAEIAASGQAMAVSSEIKRDIYPRRYKSESELLSGFLDLFEERRPDVVSGWNFIDFDWDYLLGRYEQFDDVNEHRISDIGFINGYKTERKADCVTAFDMMDAYTDTMSPTGWRSSRLDYIAKEVLGIGKLDSPSVSWTYENDRSQLAAYNIVDVMLCVAIDRKEGVHDFIFELADMSQVDITDTFSEMRLIDGYLMSNADDDEILPSMEETPIESGTGGFVLEPSDGVEEWVGVIDLKSLYPSVFMTWNISPETIHWYEDETPQEYFDGDGVWMDIPWLPGTGAGEVGDFTRDEINFSKMWCDLTDEGFVPKYLKRLFPEREKRKELRNQYKPTDDLYDVWDRKQYAIKVIMNAFYGVSGNPYWRLAKQGMVNAVTCSARYTLWVGREITEDEGYPVIYGDTDSVMISLKLDDPVDGEDEYRDLAVKHGKQLADVINNNLGRVVDAAGLEGDHPFIDDEVHGTDRHALKYEFEKLYRRFFQAGSKKRYAGNIVWKEGKEIDGDIDTVGFESERSDSPELTEEVQPEVISRVLAGDGFSEVSEYVRGLIEEIEEGDMDLFRVGMPGSVNKPLSSYGNDQIPRACRYSNNHLDYNWQTGDNPWVYFVKSTPPMTPDTDVVAVEWDEDLPDEFELDMTETLSKALEGPLSPILSEMNWRFAELKKGAKTQSAANASWDASEYDTEEDDESEDWGDWETDDDDDDDGQWGDW